MGEIQRVIDHMDPEDALDEIARVVKKLFLLAGVEARSRFMDNLVKRSEDDKVGSMVHLWLATCMGEGVDPTSMCQRLMDKVAQSRQLMAITDPELLSLFEDWFEELEEEVDTLIKKHGPLSVEALAQKLGLSERGATFLLSKLRRAGKM